MAGESTSVTKPEAELKKMRRRRITPNQETLEWINKDKDPDGFMVKDYGFKGRGVKTVVQREKGDFLLHYADEPIEALTGDKREEEHSTGFRFFFCDHKGRKLCVDVSEESGRLGRLVNHGSKKEINAVMKCVDKYLVLFAIRDIHPGEELFYDYGLDDLPWTRFICPYIWSPLKRICPGLWTEAIHHFWGSVIVFLQDGPPHAFPMQSTAMAIGSSRSDDIIVKNAAPHEVILQINCHGEILDLNDGEVQWLSSHFPHSVKTHKDFYRLKSAAVEIGKVSKLLLLTENGDVSKFKGKSLQEIQIDDVISERNLLNNGGSLECSRKIADPDKLNLSDEHSETKFPSDAGGVKCPRNRQHLYGRSVKCIRNSPNHKLNSSDIDSDDSLSDPTYMDKDSSSTDEESPPHISTKHYKQRWSPDELLTFNQIFSTCLKNKLMPTATALKLAAAKLPKRTIPQIRTRV